MYVTFSLGIVLKLCSLTCIFLHFMWTFVLVLLFSLILSLILKFIVSHCRSSIHYHTPTVEEQEEEQEGASPSQLSQTTRLFCSPQSLKGLFLSHLLLLGLLRPTTLRDARVRPSWRHTPDTFSLPTLAMGAACIPFLGWRQLRPPLSLC